MSTIKVDTIQNTVGENLVFENKNLLINGAMSIFQRNTTQASITTTGYYTADRWRLATNLGTFTQSQSTDVPSAQGFGYSLKMDCTTADASPSSNKFLILQQKIEGQNLLKILKGTSSAKKLTLSFFVKSNKTGTYVIEIDHETASRSISKSYTISSANTWEKKEITFDGDTSSTIANDNAIGLSILWWLGGGSNFTSGSLGTSWASTTDANRAVGQLNLADSTSNEWYITGCQLEVGSKATDFEFEPYERTLSRCRRYFISYGGDAAYERFAVGYISSSTQGYFTSVFPVKMREIPTYSFSSVSNFAVAAPSVVTCTSIANSHSSTDYLTLQGNVSSGLTTGRCGALIANNSTSARLKIDAEL
tara:strand:- start:128 stop:1219 length:1092 start_codon:yes stop_codon:yes gene_type:complete